MKKFAFIFFLLGILYIETNAQPNSFSTTVPSAQGDLDLVLYKYNSRGENFQVFTYDGDKLTPYTPKEIRTYRGYITNMENAKVIAVWYPNDKLYCRILFGKGEKNGLELENIDIQSLKIKKLDLPIVSAPQKAEMHFTSGYTATYDWFIDEEVAGGDIDMAIAIFDFGVCSFDFSIVRDIGASMEMNLLVLPSNSSVDKQNTFEPGKSTYPGLNKTRLFYRCFGGGGGAGRKNFCGGFYNGGRTGINLKGFGALSHELGHNFDLGHYHNQKDAMHSNMFFFGRDNAIRSRNHLRKNGANCLDVANPNYIDPVHPFTPEDYFISKYNEPVTIDVLANDVDYNGDKITIKDFDKTSLFGGTIKQDNQKLVYIPPKDFVGRDYFFYNAQSGDTEAKTHFWNEAKVMVDVRKENGLALHYKFEEKAGPMVYDQAWGPSIHHGKLAGVTMNNASGQGVSGKGIQLNGSQSIEMQDVLDPLNESLTVSIWFNFNQKPGSSEMLLFDSGSIIKLHQCGISIAVTDKKIQFYAQHEDFDFTGADRFQEVNWEVGKWYHAVLVVDRKQNKLFGYLNGKEVGQSEFRQEIATSGIIKGYPGIKFFATAIGGSARGGLRFIGKIDEFKIFTKALSTNEVLDEFNNPGGEDFNCPIGLFDYPVKNAGFEKQILKPLKEKMDISHDWYSVDKKKCTVVWSGFNANIPNAPEKDNWAGLQENAGIYQQIGTWKANEDIDISFFYGKRKDANNADLEVSLWVGASDFPGEDKHLNIIGAKKVATKLISKSELDNKNIIEKKLTFKLGTDNYDCEPLWIMFENKNANKKDVNLIDKINVANDDVTNKDKLNSEKFSVIVYPNPANNVIYVNAFNNKSNKISISISDQLGRPVKFYKKLTNKTTLDISDLASGIYLLNIESIDGTVTKKIIKTQL